MFDIAALVALIGWTLVEMLILAAIRIFARGSPGVDCHSGIGAGCES